MRFSISRRAVWQLMLLAIAAATLIGCAGINEQDDAVSAPSVIERSQPSPDIERQDAAEPLSLSLSAPEICETEAGRGGFAERVRTDAGGNRTNERVAAGLYGVAEMPVKWTVTGRDGSLHAGDRR